MCFRSIKILSCISIIEINASLYSFFFLSFSVVNLEFFHREFHPLCSPQSGVISRIFKFQSTSSFILAFLRRSVANFKANKNSV